MSDATTNVSANGATAPLGSYTDVSSATAGSDLLATVATRGIGALVGQDAALAAKYAQMEKQSANVEDINLVLKALNDIKAGTRSEAASLDELLDLSDDQIAQLRNLLGENVSLPLSLKDSEALSKQIKEAEDALLYKKLLQDPKYADSVKRCEDRYGTFFNENGKPTMTLQAAKEKLLDLLSIYARSNASLGKQIHNLLSAMSEEGPTLCTMIDTATEDIKTSIQNAELLPSEQAALDRLKANGISLTVPEAGKAFTDADGLKALDSLRTELSAAQTQQGQLNETLSLELNEIVGKRGAVLTQLQTILQSMLSARSQIARQM
jgi:hypothetical protein